jgi:hypothetical protein
MKRLSILTIMAGLVIGAGSQMLWTSAAVQTVLLQQKAAQDSASHLHNQVQQLWLAQDFAALDKLSLSLQTKPYSVLDNGQLAITAFYEALDPLFADDLEGNRQRVQRWWQLYPQSTTAWIAEALISYQQAWALRGNGAFNTLDEIKRAQFAGYLDYADELLAQPALKNTTDPMSASLAVHIAASYDGLGPKLVQAVARSVTLFPTYTQVYLEAAKYQLADWGGSLANYEAYVQKAVADEVVATKKTRAGHALYAKLYAYLGGGVSRPYGLNLFTSTMANWSHLRDGFAYILRQWPNAPYAQPYAFMACMQGDRAAYAEARSYLKSSPLPDIWQGDVDYYAACQHWADERDDVALTADGAFQQRVVQAAWQGDHGTLEKLYADAGEVATEALSARDVWWRGIEWAIDHHMAGGAVYWQGWLDRLDGWALQFPGSPLPALVRALVQMKQAQLIRGDVDVLKDDLSAPSLDQWTALVALSNSFIEQAQADGAGDATDLLRLRLYYLRITNWPADYISRLAQEQPEAFAASPDLVAQAITLWLHNPKSGEETADQALVIDRMAQQFGQAGFARYGEALYAVAYHAAWLKGYGDNLFAKSYANWPRLRQGLEDYLARAPQDKIMLNQAAQLACLASDKQALAELLPKLAPPDFSAWQGGRDRYLACVQQVR